MRIAWLSLVMLAGCERSDPLFCKMHPDMCTDGGVPIDHPMDVPDTDTAACVGTGNYKVCVSAGEQKILTAGATINTMSSPLCAQTPPPEWQMNGQPDACFVIGSLVQIPNLTITGTRPIVFVSSSMIAVTGIVDAAAHGTSDGNGYAAPACPSSTDVPADNTSGGGGGAGATFRTLAGSGGAGNSVANSGGTAAAIPPLAPTVTQAGCRGQNGGGGMDGVGTGGAGGSAGGAVVLIAGASISLGSSSIISVSGSGGHVGTGKYAGGGGGGSGGMVVLNAPMITATAGGILIANGGGGASGSANGAGTAGSDPVANMPTTAASGGPGNQGGAGGAGYALGSQAVSGVTGGASEGGGGGGGGGGFIQSSVMTIANVTSSPPLTYVP